MVTSISWAAGWSTVSTSPRPPKEEDATVGSVWATRFPGSNERYVRASPMNSFRPKPSSMVRPSWMEPMKAFTVNGFTFDLAALMVERMKASCRWILPKSLVPSKCQYPSARYS